MKTQILTLDNLPNNLERLMKFQQSLLEQVTLTTQMRRFLRQTRQPETTKVPLRARQFSEEINLKEANKLDRKNQFLKRLAQ
jgi:hypothetical protein